MASLPFNDSGETDESGFDDFDDYDEYVDYDEEGFASDDLTVERTGEMPLATADSADIAAISEEEPVGDEAVGDALAKAGNFATGAAANAGRSLAGGLSAMRKVREASKRRADAQADLRDIEMGLEEDREMLSHREDVERNYDTIVETQTAEVADAQEAATQAQVNFEQEQETVQKLSQELRSLRQQNETTIRPYRNLMDSSRGRSDAAAKTLASARRAVKNAENTTNSATKRREQNIAAANRAVDNARERLSALQAERDALSADENTSPEALAKMEAELASVRSQLETARANVPTVTQESQAAVDQAQQKLWSLQRELSSAERAADEAKREATEHKDEYDRLYREAQAAEKAMEADIKSHEDQANAYKAQREDAREREQEAQAILEEAHEIHAHPEVTEGLRERIADEEDDLELARAELEELTTHERELRRSTRGSRIAVVLLVVALVALVIFLLWFFVFRAK